MKTVVAIIQPHRLNEVRDALTEAGFHGMTAVEVRGYGRQKGQTEVYRGAEYTVRYVPKVRLEVAMDDDSVDRAIEAITGAARSGEIGDGKIFVLDLGSAMRIRTGEVGAEAL